MQNHFLALQHFLEQNYLRLNVKAEQMTFDVDNLTVTDGGHGETIDGYHFANLKYSGIVYAERLPKHKLLFFSVLIKSWLDRFDEVRQKYDLPDIKLEVIPLDNGKLIDVMATLEFVDEVYLTPAEVPGVDTIEWAGRLWHGADYPVDYAASGRVAGAPFNAD